MPWVVLIASAVCEAVWASALGQADHFTKPIATTVFLVALILSMVGLGWAARSIAIGTAYGVWTGLGTALTVGYATLTGAGAMSLAKLIFLGGIIVAVVGLKLLPCRTPNIDRHAAVLDCCHGGGADRRMFFGGRARTAPGAVGSDLAH